MEIKSYFNYEMENKKYQTVKTISKSNWQIVETGESIPITQKHMTAHFPGLVQSLH